MFVSSMYFAIEHDIVCMYIDDCSDDDSQQVLLAMGIVVGVLFLAVCTSIGCNIFLGKCKNVVHSFSLAKFQCSDKILQDVQVKYHS